MEENLLSDSIVFFNIYSCETEFSEIGDHHCDYLLSQILENIIFAEN